jgi:hypothetical protein
MLQNGNALIQCLFRDIMGVYLHTQKASKSSIGIASESHMPDLYFDTSQEATTTADLIQARMQRYIS